MLDHRAWTYCRGRKREMKPWQGHRRTSGPFQRKNHKKKKKKKRMKKDILIFDQNFQFVGETTPRVLPDFLVQPHK